MRQKRKIQHLLHHILPVVIMITLAAVAFTTSNEQFGGNLIIQSLLLYYPALFILQGILCSILEGKIYYSLGSTVIAFLIVILIWLNATALPYIIMYVLLGLIAYGVAQAFRLIRNKQ